MKFTKEIEEKVNKYFKNIKQEAVFEKLKNKDGWDFVDDGICKTLKTPDGRSLHNCEMID